MPALRDHRPEPVPKSHRRQLLGRIVDLEYDSPNRSLHLWVGPAGLHLFWPDFWKSRLDWCSNWREPLV